MLVWTVTWVGACFLVLLLAGCMFTDCCWIVMRFWIAGGLVGLRCYFAVGMFEALLIGLASEARIESCGTGMIFC